MRREDNFVSLLEEKKIVIPIIQRDYAQGRKNKKAQAVRERLIEDLIEVMNHDEKKIDLNYIYGNETEKIFYPVDGQQRLTSLYLLYWYLSFANHEQEIIKKWEFEYQTRNSALEFFVFLKDINSSLELYNILSNEEYSAKQKEDVIKNKYWFKLKWENDPTVISCIQFLILLSQKLEKHKEQLNKFWTRINNNNSAIYFTKLAETSISSNAEIYAAKKYTRMNARGKKLTEFENLKAMLDEIEKNEIDKLAYYSNLSDTISFSYDEIYINSLYHYWREEKGALNDIVQKINRESLEWFRTIYKVYCYLHKKNIPFDLEDNADTYENIMYNISQKRKEDDTICEYLYMLKAIHEVLYNSVKEKSIYSILDFDMFKRKIAFIIFVYHMWNKNNKKEDNLNIIEQWKRFSNMLDDLNYKEWNNNDEEIANVLDNLLRKIVKTYGVNDYFANNDFAKDNPFKTIKLETEDILCRIEEQQIKATLLLDKIIENDTYLDEIAVEEKRIGYFLNITNCTSNWKNGLNMQENKEKIEKYLKILSKNNMPYDFDNNENFLKTYAYASQFDTKKGILKTKEQIDECNNEHIWKGKIDLNWNDAEATELTYKTIHMRHLKTVMELISQFIEKTGYEYENIFDKFIENINNWFKTSKGYEKCWLRLILKNQIKIKEILNEELELSENGEVITKDNISIILKIYLLENAFTQTKEERIDIANILRKKRFSAKRISIYSKIQRTLTFEPTQNEYIHSKNPKLYLS